MKLKSYFSGTVEAAMELARQELGEEALLVNARPSTPETRYLGAYEVVFGIPPKSPAPAPALLPAAENSANDRLAQEVAALKHEFERMIRSLPALAGAQPQPEPQPLQLVEEPEAADLCEFDATLGRPGAERAIVTLVGPAGVGKTTTLVKLAARYGLTARKPTRILSADVYRIAAADQLRSLASILGIGCDVAETAGALAQLLEEHRTKELLFLDTPGLARADMEDAADLAALIASHPEMDTHLVLPAFMRACDMDRIVEQYRVFNPRKILFTRVDETTSYGELIAAASRHALPISFLGTGQQIPDDLEPADAGRIASLIEAKPRIPAREAIPTIAGQTILGQTKGAAA